MQKRSSPCTIAVPGIGLENVAYVDDFLALWDDDDIVYLPGCEYEVKPSAKRQIVVFEPDENCIK